MEARGGNILCKRTLPSLLVVRRQELVSLVAYYAANLTEKLLCLIKTQQTLGVIA